MPGHRPCRTGLGKQLERVRSSRRAHQGGASALHSGRMFRMLWDFLSVAGWEFTIPCLMAMVSTLAGCSALYGAPASPEGDPALEPISYECETEKGFVCESKVSEASTAEDACILAESRTRNALLGQVKTDYVARAVSDDLLQSLKVSGSKKVCVGGNATISLPVVSGSGEAGGCADGTEVAIRDTSRESVEASLNSVVFVRAALVACYPNPAKNQATRVSGGRVACAVCKKVDTSRVEYDVKNGP
jgi:hypothetical protein